MLSMKSGTVTQLGLFNDTVQDTQSIRELLFPRTFKDNGGVMSDIALTGVDVSKLLHYGLLFNQDRWHKLFKLIQGFRENMVFVLKIVLVEVDGLIYMSDMSKCVVYKVFPFVEGYGKFLDYCDVQGIPYKESGADTGYIVADFL
jgi:hypothetical protein